MLSPCFLVWRRFFLFGRLWSRLGCARGLMVAGMSVFSVFGRGLPSRARLCGSYKTRLDGN